jgi:hypothetical protein
MSCGFQSDASIPVSTTTRARAAPWIGSAAFSGIISARGVDVGRDKIRHGRGIDDAQPFDTPRAQFRDRAPVEPSDSPLDDYAHNVRSGLLIG